MQWSKPNQLDWFGFFSCSNWIQTKLIKIRINLSQTNYTFIFLMLNFHTIMRLFNLFIVFHFNLSLKSMFMLTNLVYLNLFIFRIYARKWEGTFTSDLNWNTSLTHLQLYIFTFSLYTLSHLSKNHICIFKRFVKQ